MEYHEDSTTKLQGLRHKATAPKKATTPRAARGGGESAGWRRSQRTTRST